MIMDDLLMISHERRNKETGSMYRERGREGEEREREKRRERGREREREGGGVEGDRIWIWKGGGR